MQSRLQYRKWKHNTL